MLKYLSFLLFILFPHIAFGQDCSLVKGAMQVASEIRGLKKRASVPCQLKTKADVENYLRETINTKIPREKIENEEVLYKLLGIIDPDYAYLEGIIQLYTEQVGGFYDPEKKYYAMAAWMPDMMQLPIAVHELTHALQDQHFNLEKFSGNPMETTDASLAKAALVEGDATAVMLDYSRSLTGLPGIEKEKNVSGFMLQSLIGSMLSSNLNQAPQALQSILIFPYVSGLNFVHALLQKGGYKQSDKAFSKPPQTTEEILHPEIFFRGTGNRGEIVLPEQFSYLGKPTYTDTLGEFAISTLLGRFVRPSDASTASGGWAGDKAFLFSDSSHSKTLSSYQLVWVTAWDSKIDAEDFFTILSRAYEKRFQGEDKSQGNLPEGLKAKEVRYFKSEVLGKIKVVYTGSEVFVLVNEVKR